MPPLRADTGNFHFGEPLAVASFLPVMFTTVEFNNLDLLVTAMGNDLCAYLATFNHRRTDLDIVTAADHQYLVEFHGLARGSFNLFQFEGFALNHAVLLSTADYYSVHCLLRSISLLAFGKNPYKSRGQSQAQTVDKPPGAASRQIQQGSEGGDFTQIRHPQQGLFFYKNKGLCPLFTVSTPSLDRSLGAP
jgi:hypothetical protein